MRLLIFVLGLCLCSGAFGVHVKFGDRRFPLEAVKQLKKLMDFDDFNPHHTANPHLAETSVAAVCTDPLLPQVFRPVCHGMGAALTLSRLVTIISPVDPCEICANPSCYGCLSRGSS